MLSSRGLAVDDDGAGPRGERAEVALSDAAVEVTFGNDADTGPEQVGQNGVVGTEVRSNQGAALLDRRDIEGVGKDRASLAKRGIGSLVRDAGGCLDRDNPEQAHTRPCPGDATESRHAAGAL